MNGVAAIFLLAGAVGTAAAFAVLFAKRYPRRSGWLGLGIVLGIAAMFLWPITIWVAFGMGLTGFARSRVPGIISGREPFAPLPKKVVIPACVAGALITAGAIGAMPEQVTEPGRAVAAEPDTAVSSSDSGISAPSSALTVADVVDGDTIKLSDERIIQIIGIDAPETVPPGTVAECWGPEAAMFARQTLLDKPVTLVADPTQGPVDDAGRTLSYLELPDRRDFSTLAADAGYVHAQRGSPPAQRYGAIAAAESRARAAGLGLWGPPCASPQLGSPPTADPPSVDSPPVVSPPSAPPSEAQRSRAPQTEVPQPTAQPQPASEPDPVPPPTTEPSSSPQPDPAPGSSVYYRNCSEARAAGAAPLYAGQPGYRPELDRDNDGIACES